MFVFLIRKSIRILLPIAFIISLVWEILPFDIVYADTISRSIVAAYERYLENDLGYLTNDYRENNNTLIGGIGRSELNERYRDYEVLTVAERQEYEKTMAIPETEYCLYGAEIEDFDAVIVCDRKCGYWYALEFVGLKRSDSDDCWYVAYTEIVSTGFEMYYGNILQVRDMPEVIERFSDREEYLTATHYIFLYQMLKEDMEIQLKYLHLAKNVKYPEIELLDEIRMHGAYQLSRGIRDITSIESITLHAYTSDPLSLEINYYTCCEDIIESELLNELKELLDQLTKRYPELIRNYPYAVCYAIDSNDLIVFECTFTFENYYDEDVYFVKPAT